LHGKRPRILLSDFVSVPLTCGLVRPAVVLPCDAVAWTSVRLHAVLSHEFSHIRRHDVAAQLFVHFISALWWFQPAIWLLRQRMRIESEIACDVAAVHSGLRPSVYASELLQIARSLGADAGLSSLAIGMTRTRCLEARLQAILTLRDVQSSRSGCLAFSASLTAFAVAASAITPRSIHQPISQGEPTMKNTILSALFASVSLSAATVSGSVTSPAGDAIPDAKVLVYNPDTGAKQEVTTSVDGKFSVAGTAAGQYILRVAKPGFNSSFRVFDLKADSTVKRQITMAAPGAQQVPDNTSDPDRSESKPIRVGGTVAQSNLVTKVQPLYPAAAKEAGVQGTVELEITVTKDGVPAELRVLSSPSDDLSESALEAVRQWRYRPTLLNGSPVEIVSTVVVNYTLVP
jgi:TonB family protein